MGVGVGEWVGMCFFLTMKSRFKFGGGTREVYLQKKQRFVAFIDSPLFSLPSTFSLPSFNLHTTADPALLLKGAKRKW